MGTSRIGWLILAVVLALVFPTAAQTKTKKKRSMQGRANGKLQVAPDLYKRMARYRTVEMPAPQGLSAREQQLVDKLVEANHYIEDIFWRQNDPEALTMYQAMSGRRAVKDVQLRHFIFINAGRYDLLDEDRPFVGAQPMPPGRGMYPVGLTREQIEDYVKKHPDKKDQIYSPYTVLRRRGDQIEGIPYYIAYRSFLEPAATVLREAAALSDDKDFADFLRSRADALLTAKYFDSDLKWLDQKDAKCAVIIAPC